MLNSRVLIFWPCTILPCIMIALCFVFSGESLNAFHCPAKTVDLEPNGSATVTINFLPFHSGKYQCSIIFLNKDIGEFLYSVEAVAGLPVPSTLPYRPSSHSVRISSAPATGKPWRELNFTGQITDDCAHAGKPLVGMKWLSRWSRRIDLSRLIWRWMVLIINNNNNKITCSSYIHVALCFTTPAQNALQITPDTPVPLDTWWILGEHTPAYN